MATRGSARRIVAGWIGLCLILAVAGCHLHVSFVDPSSKPPTPTSEQTASARQDSQEPSPQLVQTSGRMHPHEAITETAHYQSGMAGGPRLPMPSATTAVDEQIPHHFIPPISAQEEPVSEHAHDATHPAMPRGVGPARGPHGPPMGYVPTEKAKTSLPPYVIEPPDILLLDPIRLTPRPPYLVGPMDVLMIRVAESAPNQPIEGTYVVTPEGTINLGFNYGQIHVNGLTIEEVERAIRTQLKKVLQDPQVAVGLAQYRGMQQTRGEHLVRPDGTISLGGYGCVYVAGLTLAQAKVAIERHLAPWIQDPEVSVDVFAYNSKVYYVITDGAGYGMNVYRFPVTGNETVLDAISNIQGLPAVASRKKIWVARPAPPHHGCSQILPVDWLAITEGGVTATNYQIFPGDRVYVQADALITFDNVLAKTLAPFERILGFMLLTSVTVQSIQGNQFGGGGIGFLAPLN